LLEVQCLKSSVENFAAFYLESLANPRIDRINRMDRIKKEEAILPALSGFLNLANPVNPVYSLS
jgi:hypothetical protein